MRDIQNFIYMTLFDIPICGKQKLLENRKHHGKDILWTNMTVFTNKQDLMMLKVTITCLKTVLWNQSFVISLKIICSYSFLIDRVKLQYTSKWELLQKLPKGSVNTPTTFLFIIHVLFSDCGFHKPQNINLKNNIKTVIKRCWVACEQNTCPTLQKP